MEHPRGLVDPRTWPSLRHPAVLEHRARDAVEYKDHRVVVVPVQLGLLSGNAVLHGVPSASGDFGEGFLPCREAALSHGVVHGNLLTVPDAHHPTHAVARIPRQVVFGNVRFVGKPDGPGPGLRVCHRLTSAGMSSGEVDANDRTSD